VRRALFWVVLAWLAPTPPARAEVIVSTVVDILVDGGNTYPWQKVQLPGAVCGNGSPYKFWVYATGSPNLLLFFEGGGACWDYDTCSGRAGVLGAANPNGLPDDYMRQFTAKYVSPIVNGADPGLPGRARIDLVTKGWNIAYLPYCTGDVHIGNNVVTYPDPLGQEPPLTFHHRGYQNSIAAFNYLRGRFPSIQKLVVSGFSAGGVASSAAYWFARNTLRPGRGYLINDSGPIMLADNVDDNSRALHQTIRASWALDGVLALLPPTFDRNDFGTINRMVALEFPNDRIHYTGYTRDYNFSRFSYERFLTPNDRESVLGYWNEDQDNLVVELGRYANVGWFIPHERQINDSHCSTIITFIGSHACQKMLKKKYWWEYLEWPLGQSWKCYSEFVPMHTFLARVINENRVIRIDEPPNGYNAEDPGMQIVAGLINAALGE